MGAGGGGSLLVPSLAHYRDLLARTVPLAVELRHEPFVAVRDGDEMICTCARCSAFGYGDVTGHILGGALFEDGCPNEQPPTLTPLAMMHVRGSRWPRGSPGVA